MKELSKQSGREIARIHVDTADDLSKAHVKKFARSIGAQLTTKLPHSPRMNGQAEKTVRTIKDCIRASLHAAQHPEKYWSFTAKVCEHKFKQLPRLPNGAPPEHKLLFQPFR